MKRAAFVLLSVACIAGIAFGITKCGNKEVEARPPAVRLGGPAELLPLMNAWSAARPSGTVTVSGGDPAAILDQQLQGGIDIMLTTRLMAPGEIMKFLRDTGKKLQAARIGFQALAVAVPADHPVPAITITQLRQIYAASPGDGLSAITTWEALGSGSGPIESLGLAKGSGDREFFQAFVCGTDPAGKTGEFRSGIRELPDAAGLMAALAGSKGTIGYLPLSDAVGNVRAVPVARDGSAPAAPTPDNVRNGSYPLSRGLYLYTAGPATGPALDFMNWLKSTEGQKVLAAHGGIAER